MEFDFTSLSPRERYRLLCSFIAPRPIALVTTRAEGGHDNAAPISFFNVFGETPPLLILGISARPNGEEKDTVRHLRRTGEFTVNMVDMSIAEQMTVCGVNFASDVDEVSFSGLTAVDCRRVASRRIAESPCSMACRVERIIDFPRRAIVFGEVLEMHVNDLCLEPGGRYVNPDRYQPIARLHHDNYIVADRQFELKKPAELLPFEDMPLQERSLAR